MTTTLEALSRSLPAPRGSAELDLRRAFRNSPPMRWIVLDDDPTGTQSVRDLPVLTAWTPEDLRWALGTGCPAIYVQTNARSLDPDTAEAVIGEVVRTATHVAQDLGVGVEFVSRTDSTLRGHFPLDTDAISRACAEGPAAASPDAVLLIPAFPDAGRVTVNAVHYVGASDGTAVPAADSPFARDATFGYTASDLREWISEKTVGRVPATDVVHLPLSTTRQGVAAVTEILAEINGGQYVTVDAMAEEDLQVIAAAVHQCRAAGATFLYRVGPPFVRSLITQSPTAPLSSEELAGLHRELGADAAPGGLVVVGSHVPTTTRQLTALRQSGQIDEVVIDVLTLLDGTAEEVIDDDFVADVVDRLQRANVVISTSRDVITGTDEQDSLRIARQVSEALVTLTQRVMGRARPRFIVSKGGITSSDIATRALQIRRAMVRGQMLPGIVSLWQSVDGPATGIPYGVFAGNVGDEESLSEVVARLSV